MGSFLIEFRNGSFYGGQEADVGVSRSAAVPFTSQKRAEAEMEAFPWIALNGGMIVSAGTPVTAEEG